MAFTAQTVTSHGTVGEDFVTENVFTFSVTLSSPSLRFFWGCHEQLAFTAETVTLHGTVGKDFLVLPAVMAFTTNVDLRQRRIGAARAFASSRLIGGPKTAFVSFL